MSKEKKQPCLDAGRIGEKGGGSRDEETDNQPTILSSKNEDNLQQEDHVFGRRYDIVKQFSFPYKAFYSVQEDLICNLYNFLAHPNKKLGLFSSPTGTGKSLSLICAVLTFYQDGAGIRAKNESPKEAKDDLDEWS